MVPYLEKLQVKALLEEKSTDRHLTYLKAREKDSVLQYGREENAGELHVEFKVSDCFSIINGASLMLLLPGAHKGKQDTAIII